MIVQTAPRIKPIIENDDYKDRLRWLNDVWTIEKMILIISKI